MVGIQAKANKMNSFFIDYLMGMISIPEQNTVLLLWHTITKNSGVVQPLSIGRIIFPQVIEYLTKKKEK